MNGADKIAKGGGSALQSSDAAFSLLCLVTLLTLFDEFFAAVTKSLKKGERVRMGDLGILQVRKRAARMGRNPQTGEPIKIKASKKVAFRASKVLKDAI